MKPTALQDHRIFGLRGEFLVVFLLVVLTLGVYAPVIHYEFITYDDNLYVTANPWVKKGMSTEGIRWAFSLNDALYWHPLTWLSHMLDVELYGLNAGMHHATNLVLHLTNSVLLFLVLIRMTGAWVGSAAVAALFALHPLNVESVAWVAARKNLLSTGFWMLTVWFYLQYCRRPNLLRYTICLAAFSMGLMTKPMLVTLPFTLLLLDYWPLRRIRRPQWLNPALNRRGQSEGIQDSVEHRSAESPKPVDLREAIFEKIPLLVLAAATMYLYGASVQHLDIAVGMQSTPLTLRIANALVSYWVYLRQMVFPVHLTFLYPYPQEVAFWHAAAAAVMLIAVTGVAMYGMKRFPFLFTGWLWYLGTLVPVLGLVQAGLWPATADRFVYVPMIGIFLVLIWGTSSLASRWKVHRTGLAVGALVILVLLVSTTRRQVGFWQDNFSLYQHAIAVTENNSLAHKNLGNAYLRNGQPAKAAYHIRECLRINPADSRAHNNLAAALIKMGKFNAAVSHFEKALRLDPGYVDAQNNLKKTLIFYHQRLGRAMEAQGNLEDAVKHYRQILARYPGNAEAEYRIAIVLARGGKVQEAAVWLQRALQKGFRDWNSIRSNEHLQEVRKTALFKQLERDYPARSS